MMKGPYIFFFFFLILAITVYGSYPYYNTGNDYAGPTRFTESITTDNRNPKTVAGALYVPYVVDMDGDGSDEIIVITRITGDSSVTVYNKDLAKQEKQTMWPNITHPGTPVFIDWDGDGYIEMLIPDNTQTGNGHLEVYAFEYNGTDMHMEMSWIGGPANIQRVALGCHSSPFYCVAIIQGFNSGEEIQGAMFNDSAVGAYHTIWATVNEGYCMPSMPNIPIINWDGDAYDEAIMSYYLMREGGAYEGIIVESYNILYDNLTLTDDKQGSQSLGNEYSAASIACTAYDQLISSPYVADINPSDDDGYEVVVGFEEDVGEFRMESWDSDMSKFAWLGYPSLSNIKMDYTSNIFLLDIIPASGRTDFCISGVESATSGLKMLCASESASFLGSNTFKFGSSTLVNYSPSLSWASYPTSENTMSATYGGADRIFNTYGSWVPEFTTSCVVTGLCQMTHDYKLDAGGGAAPVDNALVINDAENEGYADIYLLQDGTVWQYDDGYQNQGCGYTYGNTTYCIYDVQYNPCNTLPWKLNTTVKITLSGIDIDADKWAGRVILYANTTDAQDSGWSANQTSGQSIPFDFVANVTNPLGIIQIMARDVENPTTVQTIEKSFSVASSGVSFNEVICSESTAFPPTGTIPTQDTSDPDNSISQAINTFNDMTGLSPALLWLIIMGLITGGIWMGGGYSHPKEAMAITIILNVIMVFLGTALGYIGSGTLIVIGVIAIAVIAVAMVRIFTGQSSGG